MPLLHAHFLPSLILPDAVRGAAAVVIDLLRASTTIVRALDVGAARVVPCLEPDHAELVIRKRRGVHNHIGTVHAIALCTGLEAAMGALAESTIPRDRRWIPKGMEVAYTAKADSDITCIAETDPEQWTAPLYDGYDLPVRVRGVRADGTVVVEGEIRLWISPRR